MINESFIRYVCFFVSFAFLNELRAETAPDVIQKSFEVLLSAPAANLLSPNFAIDGRTSDILVTAKLSNVAQRIPLSTLLWRINPSGKVTVTGSGGTLQNQLSSQWKNQGVQNLSKVLDGSSNFKLLEGTQGDSAVAELADGSYRFVHFSGDTVDSSTSMFSIDRNIDLKKSLRVGEKVFDAGTENGRIFIECREENGNKLWEHSIGSQVTGPIFGFSATRDGSLLVTKLIRGTGPILDFSSQLQIELYNSSGKLLNSCKLNGAFGNVIQSEGNGFVCVYTHGDGKSQEIIFARLSENLAFESSVVIARNDRALQPFIVRKLRGDEYVLAGCTPKGMLVHVLNHNGDIINSFDGKFVYGHAMVHDVQVLGNNIYVGSTSYGRDVTKIPITGIGLTCFTVNVK